MSDYHILEMAQDLKTVNVIFHLPIPAAGTNEAGKTWREAVVLSQGGSTEITSQLPGITQAELDALKNGSLYEFPFTVRFSSVNLTNAQRKTEIEAAYTVKTSEIVAEKQITLSFIGYESDVT